MRKSACRLTTGFSLFLVGALAQAATLTVTNNADSGTGSLRETIASAVVGDVINFDPALNQQTITLASPLNVDKAITLAGPGADRLTISGHSAVQVLSITTGPVTLSGLTIANGSAALGAGLSMSGGALTISECTFHANAASQNGGGLYFDGSVLSVSSSTFSANTAINNGGGVYNVGAATFQNATFSGNAATVSGGGLANLGQATIENSTFSLNSATANGGGVYQDATAILLDLSSSIIAENTAGSTALAGPDLYGAVTSSNGYNLVGIGTGATGLTTDQVGSSFNPVEPMLGPLAQNGGPTRTHALLWGSPAINAGDPTFLGAGLANDQRGIGFNRIERGRLDIGAVEYQNHAPLARCRDVTANVGGSCTVDVSIDDSSYDPDGGDAIALTQFPAGPYPLGNQTVTLTATDLFGAVGSCQAEVTVLDKTAPELTCPSIKPVAATSKIGDHVFFDLPKIIDNCTTHLQLPTCSMESGSMFPTGLSTVHCSARDNRFNYAECSFVVRVNADHTPPELFCPADIVVLAPRDGSAAPVDYLFPTATDNSGPKTIIVCKEGEALVPPGTRFAIGNHLVTCTGTDGSSNTGACTFNVKVLDRGSAPSGCGSLSGQAKPSSDSMIMLSVLILLRLWQSKRVKRRHGP